MVSLAGSVFHNQPDQQVYALIMPFFFSFPDLRSYTTFGMVSIKGVFVKNYFYLFYSFVNVFFFI